MTDLDNLKAMLTRAGQKFTVEPDNLTDEIDVKFTPADMDEEVLFVFSTQGELKQVL